MFNEQIIGEMDFCITEQKKRYQPHNFYNEISKSCYKIELYKIFNSMESLMGVQGFLYRDEVADQESGMVIAEA